MFETSFRVAKASVEVDEPCTTPTCVPASVIGATAEDDGAGGCERGSFGWGDGVARVECPKV